VRQRVAALGLVALAVLATGARCGTSPEELATLQSTLRADSGYSLTLVEDARSVKNLSDLSEEDLSLQRQLLRATDHRVLTFTAVEMDATAASARSTANAAADATAASVVVQEARPGFTEDLKEVTRELVREQACQAVLDEVAPPPNPPGYHETWTDLVSEVVARMVARGWPRPPDQWSRYVVWADYVSGVAEDADQLSNALLADPADIELFARPSVQRAALAYARVCYQTPRMP